MSKSQPEWESFIDMMIVQCIDESIKPIFSESEWDKIATNEKLIGLVRESTEAGILFALAYTTKYMSNHSKGE